ncbi:MAG: hypothetical protein ACKVRP_14585 [Bacteroidota bacterium]
MAYEINEGVSAMLSGVFKSDSGSLVGSGQMTTVVATLYDKTSGSIINSRNKQSVLGANGGVLDVSGSFTLDLSPLDNPILNATITGAEHHVLLLEWTDSRILMGNTANHCSTRVCSRAGAKRSGAQQKNPRVEAFIDSRESKKIPPGQCAGLKSVLTDLGLATATGYVRAARTIS